LRWPFSTPRYAQPTDSAWPVAVDDRQIVPFEDLVEPGSGLVDIDRLVPVCRDTVAVSNCLVTIK